MCERRGGSPSALDEYKARFARRLMGEHLVKEICQMLTVGCFALYGCLSEDGLERGGKN